ncbi:MAG: alpha/beta hydrolase [Prevotella sp.]|nr:alpha/beta hydrolase [Prevotella sp.]
MFLLSISLTIMAQQTFDLALYQSRPSQKSSDPMDTAKVRIFLPESKLATGRAVVICPGGGYQHLAIDKEGNDWGEFFQNQGIAAIVLKYRMPHGNPNVPIADAENAMKLVRHNAQAWNISYNDVGIMGFSAGGHLASTIATQAKGEAKPDFQILFYPVITMMEGFTHEGSRINLLGKHVSKRDEKKYSSDMNVSRTTPRAFIALSDDDNSVPPANGVNYYMELYRNDVPASLYVYPTGGHGWGSRMGFKHHLEMQLNLQSWLKSF